MPREWEIPSMFSLANRFIFCFHPFSFSSLSEKTNLLKCCLAYLSSGAELLARQRILRWRQRKRRWTWRLRYSWRKCSAENLKYPSYAWWPTASDEKSLHEWQLWLLAASLSPQWHFVMKNKWREINSCTKSDSFFFSPSFCVCATSTWLSSQVNCKQNALCVFFVLSTISTLRFLYYCLYYAASPPRTCTSALHLLW